MVVSLDWGKESDFVKLINSYGAKHKAIPIGAKT